tara:strand:- start:727 stop:1347 length:621 start_codon:yes stop_codon:yes gene_type:complete
MRSKNKRKTKRKPFTKRRKKINLVQKIKTDDNYHMNHCATTVRKKYGIKLKNNKENIKEGLSHLMKLTNNNSQGIGLTFVNLSDIPITVQFKNNEEWVTPKHNSKGKDKIPWSNIKPCLSFPYTDYNSIKQITGYLNSLWRILYMDKELIFKLLSDNIVNNNHVILFTKNNININEDKLERFFIHRIKESDKVNNEDGFSVSWNSK